MHILSKNLATDQLHMTLRDQEGLDNLFKMLGTIEFDFPIDVQIQKARKERTFLQNRTAWQYWRDAEAQGDMKAWEYRAYCKLHFGVPILRRDSYEYKELYDLKVKPYNYEQKLSFMMEPFDFPVTRAMNVRQHSEFLDRTARHLQELGFQLTEVKSN
tara:strand:- start:2129 stop:2602 length:474 start_codon:yes stop_codon:yes gene_type:complete